MVTGENIRRQGILGISSRLHSLAVTVVLEKANRTKLQYTCAMQSEKRYILRGCSVTITGETDSLGRPFRWANMA
jgi:hypothetical protein